MPVLRCDRVTAGDVDRALVEIGPATLARTPAGAFVAVPAERRTEAIRLLAFAGVRARDADVALAPPHSTRPAVGRDLTPLAADTLALDLVHVRPLPLGVEARRLIRRSLWRRPSDDRRLLCRELLQGANAVIGWRRRAWATRDVLRDAATRRVLRAVVFDVTAIGAPPEHRALARDGSLGAWLFG